VLALIAAPVVGIGEARQGGKSARHADSGGDRRGGERSFRGGGSSGGGQLRARAGGSEGGGGQQGGGSGGSGSSRQSESSGGGGNDSGGGDSGGQRQSGGERQSSGGGEPSGGRSGSGDQGGGNSSGSGASRPPVRGVGSPGASASGAGQATAVETGQGTAGVGQSPAVTVPSTPGAPATPGRAPSTRRSTPRALPRATGQAAGVATGAGQQLGRILETPFPTGGSLPSADSGAKTPAPEPAPKPKKDEGFQPLPTPVTKVIEAIPTAIWIALGALAALATALAGTALVAGRRARRSAAAVRTIQGRAISDALTGVLNRGAFEDRLRGELARARRYGRPLGLLTFDVAGLKAVNDAHGHSAGDDVLKSVAGAIRDSIRDHDLVGRMGGDEYAVVVTEQARAGTERVLERIQSEMPKRRAALGLHSEWGLSAGIAEFPHDGDTAEALLKAADRRLYLSRGIKIQPVA
jgi:diguanylate cyclase (GGDEF)-like protein